MTIRLHCYLALYIGNTLLAISTILAGTTSHLNPSDTQTTRNIDNLVVRIENRGTKAGNKDIENNSESALKTKPARIGIILLSLVSVIIILLIVCTYPLEKYQITKYRQKENLFNV